MERGTVTTMPAAGGNDHYDVLVIGGWAGSSGETTVR